MEANDHVLKRRHGKIGYVELNNPPVNTIGEVTRKALVDAVSWAESEPGLERIILSGLGRAFSAGADAQEFDSPPVKPHLPDILNLIDRSTVPWVAAVNGIALGGGLELALACRYRICTPTARLGMPEVTLGVIPGAGGTQRLPRLVGLENALQMICFGQQVGAARAKAMGLADEIADDPVAFAAQVAVDVLISRPAVSDIPPPLNDDVIVDTVRSELARKKRNQSAPERAVEIIQACTDKPFTDAVAQERAAFLELRASSECRALRHIFFAERAARSPAWLTGTEPATIKKAIVVGAGTMGASIAYALLSAGIAVNVVETDESRVSGATANILTHIESGLRRGLLTAEEAARWKTDLQVTADYENAYDADLAIEAAFENMDVKKNVFRSLEKALRADAVLATNTSYLNINEIAETLTDPSRLAGLHFFAPAHIMKLLEIVRGEATSLSTLSTGFALAQRLKKVPVLASVCDGFIGNRILARYREAADTLLLQGATPWEIDEAMVEFGYPMGPYEAQDLSGLDIAYANRQRKYATRNLQRFYPKISDRMVEAGRLGKKSGQGWYAYSNEGQKSIDPRVEELIHIEARQANLPRKQLSQVDIQQRLLTAMINEGADILWNDIARSPKDIDLVTVLGYGFPRWRGGLMHYADQVGIDEILIKLTTLSSEDPVAWQPSPGLLALKNLGRSFAEWDQDHDIFNLVTDLSLVLG